MMGFSWDDLLPIAGGVGGFIVGGPAGAGLGYTAGTVAKNAVNSGSGNPTSSPGTTAYQPNPGAFGPLTIDVGAPNSAGTSAAQGTVAGLTAKKDEATEAYWQSQVARQGQYDPYWQQLMDPDPAKRDAARQAYLAQVAAAPNELAQATAPYDAALADAQKRETASFHADQLGGLVTAAGAAQNRPAPQINQGPTAIDWNNVPPEVAAAHSMLTQNHIGRPPTPEQISAANATIAGYQNQLNQSNPLYVDAQRQQQDRTNQLAYGSMLTDAANGKGPSVAMDTLMAGRDANIRQAQSMANSTRGGEGNQALAARSALYAGAQATQDTSRQAAILGAQEQQAARAQLGTALTGIRAGDQGQFGTNAGIATTNAGTALGQGAQNDQSSQFYMDLYFRAQQGDRDAQMELEKLRSGNANAANANTTQANINNADIGYKQGVDNTRLGMSLLNGVATTYASTQAQPKTTTDDKWGF